MKTALLLIGSYACFMAAMLMLFHASVYKDPQRDREHYHGNLPS